jgi:formylmethanofuran dehydrogenase subunit C
MKTILISLAVGVLLALSAGAARAQSYSIDWYKISGGGGTSSNGQFTVSGTIGQHDAGGPMTGGNYSLTGGFWSFLSVVQTVGSPTLRIFLTTTNTAVVAWPAPSTGFALQVNTNLSTPTWVGTSAPAVVGSENQVIIAPPVGRQFFRLKSP